MRQFLQSALRHILAYAPGTIAVNVTWMERRFNAGQTHSSMYPSIFSEILVGNCNFFQPPAFNAPVGRCSRWNSGKSLVVRKLESWATRQWRQFDDRLSRFDTIPACDGQTDRQPDVQPISITCTVWLTHVKNTKKHTKIHSMSRRLTKGRLHTNLTSVDEPQYYYGVGLITFRWRMKETPQAVV